MSVAVPVACVLAAAAKYQIHPAVIYAVLETEGGREGTVSQNTNGTADLGPMQINTIWLGPLSERYQIDIAATRHNLIHNACFNVDAGTFILASRISEEGDFWQGVAAYHSRTPHIGRRYLTKVVERYKRILAGLTVGPGLSGTAVAAPVQRQPATPRPLVIRIAKPDGVRAVRSIDERLNLQPVAGAALGGAAEAAAAASGAIAVAATGSQGGARVIVPAKPIAAAAGQ